MMQPTQPRRDRSLKDDSSESVRTASFLDANSQETTVNRSDTDVPPPAPPPPVDLLGQIARFEIRQRLGQGGFGAVYLARDPVLQRDVALKLPCEGDSVSPEEADRFVEEARIAAQLKHPHVVTIYDVGRCDRSGVFIAMEYVAGESLAGRLKRGRLGVDETVRICGQIADAIHHGHKLGLIHRDLKPGNVLLDQDGQVKVCDFGLALREESQTGQRGDASGTRPYMSPEQIRGEVHLLDGRSDLWSLGIILYECLSGRRPFRGDTLAEMHEDILTRDPKPLNQFDDAIPAQLDELFRHCTRREIANRLRTGLEFKQALDRIAKPVAPRKRLQFALVAGLVAVLILAAIVGAAAFLPRNAQQSAADFDPNSGIVDLLAKPPIPIDFAFTEPDCNYSYMPHARRLTVDSRFWSVFACGTNSGDCQLDAAASFPDGPAMAGMFWGLHSEPAADGATVETCLAIVVTPPETAMGNAMVHCYQLVIGKNAIGQTTILGKSERAKLPIVIDWDVPLNLQFRLRDGQPTEIVVQDLPRAIRLPEKEFDWMSYAAGKCGIVTKGSRVVFTRVLQSTVNVEQ